MFSDPSTMKGMPHQSGVKITLYTLYHTISYTFTTYIYICACYVCTYIYIYACYVCIYMYNMCLTYIYILIFMDSYAYKTDYITSSSKILGVTKAWPWTGDPGVHRSRLPRRTRMRFTRRRSDVWTINWSKRNKNLKSYQLLGLGKP